MHAKVLHHPCCAAAPAHAAAPAAGTAAELCCGSGLGASKSLSWHQDSADDTRHRLTAFQEQPLSARAAHALSALCAEHAPFTPQSALNISGPPEQELQRARTSKLRQAVPMPQGIDRWGAYNLINGAVESEVLDEMGTLSLPAPVPLGGLDGSGGRERSTAGRKRTARRHSTPAQPPPPQVPAARTLERQAHAALFGALPAGAQGAAPRRRRAAKRQRRALAHSTPPGRR
eukprot:g2323.t1